MNQPFATYPLKFMQGLRGLGGLAALILMVISSSVVFGRVKIGLMVPLTGGNAVYGKQMENGAELAVELLNKKGGILGEQIDLMVGDDGADPKQGVVVANKFLGDGINLVIGAATSAVTEAVMMTYSDHHVLQISVSATAPHLTEKGAIHFFRLCGRNDQQSVVAAHYLLENLKDKRMALLHDKSVYGKGLTDAVKKSLNDGKVQEILYEGVNAGDKDYSALITKLKSLKAEVVYWGGYATEAGLIIRQMREQGLSAIMVSADGIATEEFLAIGGEGVEGSLFTYSIDPRSLASATEIVQEFSKRHINSEAYTLYSYAAVQILQQAAEKAGSLSQEKISEVLHSGAPFNTVIGPVSFDSKGEKTKTDYGIYIWKKTDQGLSYQLK